MSATRPPMLAGPTLRQARPLRSSAVSVRPLVDDVRAEGPVDESVVILDEDDVGASEAPAFWAVAESDGERTTRSWPLVDAQLTPTSKRSTNGKRRMNDCISSPMRSRPTVSRHHSLIRCHTTIGTVSSKGDGKRYLGQPAVYDRPVASLMGAGEVIGATGHRSSASGQDRLPLAYAESADIAALNVGRHRSKIPAFARRTIARQADQFLRRAYRVDSRR